LKNKYFFTIVVIVIISSTGYSAQSTRTGQGDSTVVGRFGLPRVAGNRIIDQNGNPLVLRGMSLFWSQWMAQFYNSSCIGWLYNDWKCTVVRAAMAVGSGGYLTNPAAEKAKIKTVIDACISNGIYVIVDWHDDNAQNHLAESIAFFEDIARQYGDKPNLIYEIYNEPLQVSWTNVIKPYADSVVKHIRAIDPDNLIIVGTPTWSQDVDVASLNPLTANNVAYTLHFYAATHKQSLRNKAQTALNNGIALFVTEFGTCESSGTGVLDSNETKTWLTFLDANKISWCNWAIEDKAETAAALVPGSSGIGNWPISSLTASGLIIRQDILTGNSSIITSVRQEEQPSNFRLNQNYPNPFNPETTIEYHLNKSGQTKLEIFDLLGRNIAPLVDQYEFAGQHRVQWNGLNENRMPAASGVYMIQITFGSEIQRRKIILLR